MMGRWDERFNQLSPEIRQIGTMCECEMRINQLKIEKDRLRKR